MRALGPKPIELRTMAALVAVLAATAARGDDATAAFGISEALAQGRFTLELRPRYNQIDESDKPLRTQGVTVRVVPGWKSAAYAGLRLTFEVIHTDNIGPKRYNDSGAMNATSPYPLLPDPRHTGVNQAHVEYRGIDALRLRLGRQVVRVDNQRWISDNDFRQIPMLFDGLTALYAGGEKTELMASHFWRVRTTSGVTNRLELSLLHAAWNPAPTHSLAAFAYFHDQPQNGINTGFADNSYRVIGARAEGSAWSFGAIEVPYLLEYAQQRPHAGGDSRIDADYWRAGAGLATAQWTVRYDYEVKGSNEGRYGMQMPFTDLYAFNGWTLNFRTTPRTGLRDQWVTLRYAPGTFTLYAESHRFKSDYGGTNLGRENDIGLTYAFAENCIARLQHARYDPGPNMLDPRIRKTWLTLTYSH